ncbi:DUF5597 domain-containing protein [Sphingomonas piscis]|uniref:DUF5597 domain-containing protein n=1 Tax=Sphingomonas piscis TaxID=2714943 RepID=A0A6G7YMS9_9SPHN|nr:DUF5597 domain-containing protein [Sphingomonas piscis]QIK78041.1 DUF5597 domain-containing protein [Sphingomonas piscis]
MKSMKVLKALVGCLVLSLSSMMGAAQAQGLPHLERRGAATQLIVDGKPFLILGGETHNSSYNSADYMAPVWPMLRSMNLNTVLVPVAWEDIEPQEGHFTFKVVDDFAAGARKNNLRLVILWFGSWKNTYSSYVPAWVKSDLARFPRVEMSSGQGTERLSPFSSAAQTSDARAFARLMRHIAAIDRVQRTVLMVQVQNEVGVIPQSRDHSAVAEAAFAAPVPSELMQHLTTNRTRLNPTLRSVWEAAGARASGTWQEVFGTGSVTDHLFMSWFYATYVEKVTAAGKAEYPLPMFTNAALIRPNYEPGQYNSGGPLPSSLDIWKAGAPSLEFLSPDIYFDQFVDWAAAYNRSDNPLFIPEARGGKEGAANALHAFGALNALGFSPFGIDGSEGAGDLDGNGQSVGRRDDAIGHVYGQLAGLAPLILQKQAEGNIRAMVMEGEAQRAGRLRVGNYLANMVRAAPPGGTIDPNSRVGAMLLQIGPDEFLVVGSGDAQLTFTSDTKGLPIVGIQSIDEVFLRNGGMVAGRRLNGDESGQGQLLRLLSSDAAQGKIYRVRLYRYR